MENKIRLLPEIVANQIAAGEVVNNPSSVVKEMMENAIDAGASSVTVNYRNAGLELIQIVDNGCGMSPLDARMAFDRHATSKISTLDDVYRLHTFGFRGEALASIAAVAQVELRTRRAEDEIGTVTIVTGGEFVSQTPAMCPAGSQFLVRNLFYTAPARRKFNSDRTRMVSDIKKEFRRVALCYPHVRFELMSNDMPIMTLPAASLQERIIDVVGRYIRSNLLEVAVDTSIVKVTGFVGRPSAAKQKNAEQYLFVNGRYFRSPQIFRSIMKAYEKLIPENCSPSFFLYLTVEPDRVDVNVHPQKTEVRFADGKDGICNLMNIYSAFTGKTNEEIEKEFAGKGYGEFKAAVGETCADCLEPVRQKYALLVEGIMKNGAAKAQYLARKTLSKVYRKVGFYACPRD